MSAGITVEDMKDLRHMLGIDTRRPRKTWGYRNNYCTFKEHPGMMRLEALGWVRWVPNHLNQMSNDVIYMATMDGCLAAGLDKQEAEKLLGPSAVGSEERTKGKP